MVQMIQIKVDDLGVELGTTSEHRIVSFIFGETHNGAAVGGVVFCLFLRQRKTSSLQTGTISRFSLVASWRAWTCMRSCPVLSMLLMVRAYCGRPWRLVKLWCWCFV
jgi:hypothetical protein